VLALFVQAYVQGASLLKALKAARVEAGWHSMAQSLLKGFWSRGHVIRTYLSRRRHRCVPVPPDIREDRRPIAELYFGLMNRWLSPVPAFVHHGRCLHQRMGATLA
jgi:hypothetical protein